MCNARDNPRPFTKKLFLKTLHREARILFLEKAWIMILIGSLWNYVHSCFHNFITSLAATYKVYGPYGYDSNIHDFGFDLFGTALKDLKILPANMLTYTFLLFALIGSLWPFFCPTKHAAVQAIWRTLCVSTITITLRILSFSFTLLPSPTTHCSVDNLHPFSVSTIFFNVATDTGCSDLIFSGHMNITLLVTMAYMWYCRKRYINLLLVAMASTQACFIVAQQSHYTVDVIIACYVVPAIWITFAYFVPNDPVDTKAPDGEIGPQSVTAEERESDETREMYQSPQKQSSQPGLDLEVA